MDSHGVYVFHRADGEHVARAVAENLELYLLPSAYVLLNEHLRYGREQQAVVGYEPQLLLIVCHAAAGAAQSVRRAHNYGIAADALCNLHALVHRVGDVRRHDRLVNFLHGLLEQLSVFGAVYGVQVDAYELHAVLVQEAGFCQLASEGEPRLPAEAGEDGVRFLLQDYALQGVRG